MGRCYEFGVLVGEGCEHAMVVPGSGQRCECATCGVTCTGKFAACETIIAKPGYVPATAPPWALRVGSFPEVPARASGGVVGRETGSGPGSPKAGSDPADLVGAIEGVAKQLAEHDVELATRLDALAGEVAELQRRVSLQESALQAVLTRLAGIERKLDEPRLGSLFGLTRRQS